MKIQVLKVISWVIGIGAAVLYIAGAGENTMQFRLLAVLLLVVYLPIGMLVTYFQRKGNEQKPIVTVEARVVSHRTLREKVGRNAIIRYYITFRPADGSMSVELEVSKLDFEDFDQGETGTLRYRGWEFLSFGLKDKSAIKPIAPLPEEYEPQPEPKRRRISLKEAFMALRIRHARLSALHKTEAESAPVKDQGILTHELED